MLEHAIEPDGPEEPATPPKAPAIFVMEGKTPMLVNYRVKHSLYIVDRLFDRAQLRIGPKTAVDIGCVHRFASR